MFRAALIDMDGFLINSEQLYLEANITYFKQFNFEFTEALHRQGTGKKFDKWITSVVPLDKSGEEILKERNVIFFDLVRQKLALLAGAKELLELLHSKFKTALVTSSERDYIDLVFEKTHIEQYFDLQITGDMVTLGKPDPECYLMAAEQLKVEPSECIVFEDAPSGILAGKNAGMKVIAVPSPYVKGNSVFKQADIVLDNLHEITYEIINE
jgi:16S rRNA pseudouridine516 synthase